MPITIDYQTTVVSGSPSYTGGGGTGTDYSEYGDACSILVPVDVIGSGVFVSVTANGIPLPEDNSPSWNASVTYGVGARVHLPGTHRVYESANDGNTGRDPSQPMNQYNAAGVATWWIDLGTTNKYAMFDSLVSTPTSAPSPLEITILPGAFNGFALFGLDADSYAVEVIDTESGAIIYSEPVTALDSSMPSDYYEYFFERAKPQRQLIRTGIEPYDTARLKLTLYKGTGDVKLGMFAIGDLRPVGVPQRDVSVDPVDFSYFKQDAFGNATVKKRANATGMSISTKMEMSDASVVLDTIKEVLGTPVVVVGSEAPGFEWLTVFGLVSGRMSPAEYPFATLNITVKGFI